MADFEIEVSSSTLLVAGLCLSVLQLCWILSVVVRNQRQRGGQPLSRQAFQKELNRILQTIDS